MRHAAGIPKMLVADGDSSGETGILSPELRREVCVGGVWRRAWRDLLGSLFLGRDRSNGADQERPGCPEMLANRRKHPAVLLFHILPLLQLHPHFFYLSLTSITRSTSSISPRAPSNSEISAPDARSLVRSLAS